jgi:hypothetical protein
VVVRSLRAPHLAGDLTDRERTEPIRCGRLRRRLNIFGASWRARRPGRQLSVADRPARQAHAAASLDFSCG